MGRTELGDLGPQVFDLGGILRLRALRAGDQLFRLGAGPALGLKAVAGLGQLDARLRQSALVPVQRLLEFRDLLGVDGLHVHRKCRRDERGDGPLAAHRAVEEITQLPAQLQRFERLGRVEEVVVRGVVPPPAELVERLTAPADEHARARERVETVELGRALDARAGAGDELLRQHLAELTGADVGGVRVGEDRQFRLRAIDGEKRLIAVQTPEVG
ncbi:hypothetical protein [Streptomyces sasae]|uniref:hypothetical protein n=1 Tax=Streptomyces sasae TaxID=1266772 RepID=UPI00292E807A|nr:hypothetical protein [Streptomyces sasae]